MTTLELIAYYVNLLILQYVGRPKAQATIAAQVTPVIMPQSSEQSITFPSVPVSGHFVVSYNGVSSANINWNDPASTIQTTLRAVTGLSSITVSGSIASQTLDISFVGVTPPAALLVLVSTALFDGVVTVTPVITEIDITLPLAVQAGFNLLGDNTAVGVQLDVLGQYAGVSRTGAGFYGQITLDDTDFLSLIRMAITQNSAGSSLAEIQGFLNQYFPGQILVFDYQNMNMSYLISSAVGSVELVQLFINEGLLPKPMAVNVGIVIYAPVINTFFGFRTYSTPAFNASPFNSYADYHLDYPWLSYADAI